MNSIFLRLHVRLHELTSDEQGQDMVEYALVVALIALAATAAMTGVGTALTNRFNAISTAIG